MQLKRIYLPLMVFALATPTLAQETASTPQDKLCIYTDIPEGQRCKDGELSYYKPNRWGNEQVSTKIAALFCDTNHRIFATKAGVLCTHTNRSVIYFIALLELESYQESERQKAQDKKKELKAQQLKIKQQQQELDDLI